MIWISTIVFFIFFVTRKRVYCRLRKRVTLISWEAEHPEQQIGWALYAACYIRVTRWLVTRLQSSPIGTNFAGFYSNLKQFYWCKRRGLFSNLGAGFSALLRAFYWVHIDWPAPGHPTGVGNPTISRETETQVPAPCQPQPRQPHIPSFFFVISFNLKT